MNAEVDTAVESVDAAPMLLSKAGVFVQVLRRAGPRLLEASLIPTALFYCGLMASGLFAAYAAALLWTYSAVAWRLRTRRTIPPLLVLGVIGITIRTAVAVASGSSFLYFAQPVITSFATGALFLVSICVGRPLVEKLALDFWPLTPEMLARPAVGRLLRGLTFLWAGINLVIGVTTLVLLLSVPVATYVAVKQVLSLALMATGMVVTIDLSVRTARREGVAQRPPSRRDLALALALEPAA